MIPICNIKPVNVVSREMSPIGKKEIDSEMSAIFHSAAFTMEASGSVNVFNARK